MPIDARCQKCGKGYQLADEQAGLRVRCRECQTDFDVPRRADILQVVPKPAPGPRLAQPDEDDPIARKMARPGSGNRTLYVVAGVLASTMVVVALGCGGLIWMVSLQMRQTVQQAAQEIKPPPPPIPVPPAPPPVQPPVPPVEAGKAVGGAGGQPDLGALGGLLKLATMPGPANMEEAMKNLKSKESVVRFKALEYISKQPPPEDAALRKKILAEVNGLSNDDDPFVKLGVTSVKIAWDDL